MAAKLVKAKPGIYRRGAGYVVMYRDGEGRQHKESARTQLEAERLLVKRRGAVLDGSYQARTRERFADYATAWVERYQGTGRRGFAEHTRADYRRDLRTYAIPRLGRLRLEQITPRHIAEFVAWLCDEQAQERYLANATVRRILAPVRSCLRSAMREGLIRHNPTQGAALPARDERKRIEDDTDDLGDGDDIRALSTEQLVALLRISWGLRHSTPQPGRTRSSRSGSDLARKHGRLATPCPIARSRRCWRAGDAAQHPGARRVWGTCAPRGAGPS
jgi:hypothetical protein